MTYSVNLHHKYHTARINLICTPLIMRRSSLRCLGRRSSEVK